MKESALYVGDSSDVVNRILGTHCTGNVEGSALRLAVAQKLGFPITRMKRTSGTTKIRIGLPDPRAAELRVSNFIRSCVWRYVLCHQYGEAHDFQWYAIDNLRPELNKRRRQWVAHNAARYAQLLEALLEAPPRRADQLDRTQSGPGVYLLTSGS